MTFECRNFVFSNTVPLKTCKIWSNNSAKMAIFGLKITKIGLIFFWNLGKDQKDFLKTYVPQNFTNFVFQMKFQPARDLHIKLGLGTPSPLFTISMTLHLAWKANGPVLAWEKNNFTCSCFFLPRLFCISITENNRNVKKINLCNAHLSIRTSITEISNQIFHYTRCITLKRVTSLRGPYPRHCAWQHSFFRRNVAEVASRWPHCVQFDRTSDLPLRRRMRYRSTCWTITELLRKTYRNPAQNWLSVIWTKGKAAWFRLCCS